MLFSLNYFFLQDKTTKKLNFCFLKLLRTSLATMLALWKKGLVGRIRLMQGPRMSVTA